MHAGKLRHRVLIEELVAQVDTSDDVVQDPSTGVVARTWTPVAEVWASIEPLSAREFIAAQATQSKVTTRVTIRYRAINPAARLVHMVNGSRGTIYNVEGGLADKESGREYLTLPCSAGVSVDGQ